MTSIYKPTRLTKNGQRVKCRHWYVLYRDAQGQRHNVKGYKDKAATIALARKLETDTERQRAGIPPQIAKRYRDAVDAYLDDMNRLGRDHTYRQNVRAQLAFFCRGRSCLFALTDITPQYIREKLKSLVTKAPVTQNAYRGSLHALLEWCKAQHWLTNNPAATVKKASTIGRKTRNRRAYTEAELQRLLEVASPQRAEIYRLAALSGLRRREISLLTADCLSPDAVRWTLPAAITKSRRHEDIPVMPELRPWLKHLREHQRILFPTMPRTKTFNADLAKAGIPKFDAAGRSLDFHSLRYTFCTMLARRLPIQVVRLLMRHRDIRTTCNLYLDLGLQDALEAVHHLPNLLAIAPEP